jgi:hypothetical protein
MSTTYYAILDDPTKGLNAINLHSLVMHILTTYAQISQLDLDDNMTDFHSGINLPPPLAIYTRKQEKCQVFAANARVPISDKTMITTGTKHSIVCSIMMLAWREWKHHPLPDHTWPNWKSNWTAAFAEMHNINWVMAGNTAFGANQAAELKQVQQMASSLDNLAKATTQKNTTIENLVAINTMLTKAIADIQISIAPMCAAKVPTSHAPTAPAQLMKAHVCPSHWSTPNQLGTKLGTAGHMATRSRLVTAAPPTHCTRLAISPAQPGQTSWVAARRTPDTPPPLHPSPDGVHQQTFIPSAWLV